MIWVLFWKGFALWTAAKRDNKKWFVALIIINTVGILEIIYLFFYAKKKWVDVKALFVKSSPKIGNDGTSDDSEKSIKSF